MVAAPLLGALFLSLLPLAASRGQEPEKEVPLSEKLARALDAELETLETLRAAGSSPAIPAGNGAGGSEEPPTTIMSAGPEFVAVWREYRRACSPPGPSPEIYNLPDGKNAGTTGYVPYQRLVGELLAGTNLPSSKEFEGFYCVTGGFCGNAGDWFYGSQYYAMVLADVKGGRLREAAGRMLDNPDCERPFARLLTLMGCDRAKVLAGRWLSGELYTLEAVCAEGSDAGAQMVLRWAELHWGEAVAASKEERRTRALKVSGEPQVPTLELLKLLRSDNAVSTETKQRVASFVNSHIPSLEEVGGWLGVWLADAPTGSERLLKPLALAALQGPRNRDRLLGENALRAAGDSEAKAVLHPGPRYRVFINGKLWRQGQPDSPQELTGWVRYSGALGCTGSSLRIVGNADGVIELDADAFTPPEDVRGVSFGWEPYTRPKALSPADAWIRTEVPLPVRPGEIVDLPVKTVAVTIRPHFPPRRGKQWAIGVMLEFGPLESVTGGPGQPCRLPLPMTGELVLPRVQPGDYLLSVRAPGAAAFLAQKVHVKDEATVLEPTLAAGSNVVVPLVWFGPVIDPTLEPVMSSRYLRDFSQCLSRFFAIERDGVPQGGEWNELQGSSKPGVIDGLGLHNLPVGNYRVRLKSTAELRQPGRVLVPDRLSHDWEATEMSFVVEASSPPAFVTEPLQIKASP